MNTTQTTDRPLAVPPLRPYRYRGKYGWIMIAARDNAEALTEAQRSTGADVHPMHLQIWDGEHYVPVC